MALSRLFGPVELCGRSALFSKNVPKSYHNVRAFRKATQDTKTSKFQSVASPFQNVVNPKDVGIKNLWRPFIFTVTFSSACFAGATVWQYESMRSHAVSMLKQPVGYAQKKIFDARIKAGSWRQQMNIWWNGLTPGEKIFIPICTLNVLVFMCWRIPRLQPQMLKYFCSNPGNSNACWPMLLSTFSHYSVFHLFANMYVLHSFSTGAVASLGKEQFLGLYLSAGVLSSFASYVYKSITKQPGLSLGASGAIMAILGYVCAEYPETKLGIIFLPFLTFSAGTAIKAILSLDLAGVLLGWKIFDHAAHLGGAAYGIAWSYWGNELLWHNREPILQYWHELRGAIK